MSNICPPESSDREVSAGKTRGWKRRREAGWRRVACRHRIKKPSSERLPAKTRLRTHARSVTYATFPKQSVKKKLKNEGGLREHKRDEG